MTTDQKETIDAILATFGGDLTVQPFGKKAFITVINNDRTDIQGRRLSGTISQWGDVFLTLTRQFGNAQIEELGHLKGYL